jgi:hypothetical protein
MTFFGSTTVRLSRPALLGLLFAGLVLMSGCEDYTGSLEGRVIYLPVDGVRIPNPKHPDMSLAYPPMAGVQVEVKSIKDGTKRYGYSDCTGRYFIEDVRYGPNRVRLHIENSRDVLDESGNLLCEATAIAGYQQTRTYYVDILRNKTRRADLVAARIPESRPTGLTVTVRDGKTNDPIRGAKVDLYSGLGAAYIYVDTKTTDPWGRAVFYERKVTRFYQEYHVQNPAGTVLPLLYSPSIPVFFTDEFTIHHFRCEIAALNYRNKTVTFTLGFHAPMPYEQTVFLLQEELSLEE